MSRASCRPASIRSAAAGREIKRNNHEEDKEKGEKGRDKVEGEEGEEDDDTDKEDWGE